MTPPTHNPPLPAPSAEAMAAATPRTTDFSIGRIGIDPEHQDLVNTLNNMARAAIEKDELAYEAFYFSACEQLEALNETLSRKGGFQP